MTATPTITAEEARTEEVRIAIALNGGVSLAVWMGGCAVELDAARRAHLGPEKLGPPDPPPTPDPPPPEPRRLTPRKLTELAEALVRRAPPAPQPATGMTRTVYHQLCAAFKRELVIDLVSGASAGGINGALLCAASVHERRLQPDFVRAKWLELGDLGRLLQQTTKTDPASLMRGVLFHDDLLAAFRALTHGTDQADDEDKRATDLAAAELCRLPDSQQQKLDGRSPWLATATPKLDITTTDLIGEEHVFADAWGEKLVANEYRARFRLRSRDDYKAPLLAAAARSSASFPFAFKPWQLKGDVAKLADIDADRWVIDGGVLDNAPIQAVLDLIPDRPAARQVKRFVCYLNADPPVADTPKQRKPNEDPEQTNCDEGPTLLKIGGAVLGLPRKAPFIDQLRAIERSTRQAGIAMESEMVLLQATTDDLRKMAEILLPTYRKRRRADSLDELLEHPRDVRAVLTKLKDGHDLPWIPHTLDVPSEGHWGWGVRGAQRVLHLLLDALRAAIGKQDDAGKLTLLTARAQVDAQRMTLVKSREDLLGDAKIKAALHELAQPAADVAALTTALSDAMCDYDHKASRTVRAAAATVFGVRSELRVVGGMSVGMALFGVANEDGEASEELCVATFIERALSIEVVRRAFAPDRDIDSSQHIEFVQLTPFTKIPILQAPGSDQPCPSSPQDKLAGLELGHFAAFYRRAWRANDFMWGRLDAAARIVEVLVDSERAREVDSAQPAGEVEPPADTVCMKLTACLLPSMIPDADLLDERWLVQEIIGPALAKEAVPQPAGELRPRLLDVLAADLLRYDGQITRTLLTRAVQLEILRQELPVLVASDASDHADGAGSAPLSLKLGASLRPAIVDLRPLKDAPADRNESLPARLGAHGKVEIGSDLGLRTTTHIVFVALAALRHAKVPLAGALYAIRAVLFPVAGIVARVVWYRLAVVLGFWAAATYLTARVIKIPANPSTPADTLFATPQVIGYLALLAVVGVVAVPVARAFSSNRGRIFQGIAAAVFLATGGIAAGVLARYTVDEMGWADVLIGGASTATELPNWIAGPIVVLVLGTSIARVFPFARTLIFNALRRFRLVGATTVVLLALATLGVVVAEVVMTLGGQMFGPDRWQSGVFAWLAVIGAPAAALIYVARGSARG